jgi:hypothetical protein
MAAKRTKKDALENALVLADALMERGYPVTVDPDPPLGEAGLTVSFKTQGYQEYLKAILRIMEDGRIRILLDQKLPALRWGPLYTSLGGTREPSMRDVLDRIGLGAFIESSTES